MDVKQVSGEPKRNFCCGKVIMIRIGEVMFQITEILLILHPIFDVVFKSIVLNVCSG